jgi:hypothetical protein
MLTHHDFGFLQLVKSLKEKVRPFLVVDLFSGRFQKKFLHKIENLKKNITLDNLT